LKNDIRRIKRSLEKIKEMDTNMRLTTATFDSDVMALADEMNKVMDKQRALQIENDRVGREFRQGITNISHDLRTPLTSASGYVDLIKSGLISEEKSTEYLDVIHHRLKSLTALMNQLFDYMQLIEGKNEMNFEAVDVCHLISEELALFYDPLTTGGFQVTVDLPEAGVQLIADETQLKRVINNLISNVIKHGTDFFSVKVTQDGLIQFSNRVNEVEKLDVTRLFERFYTADTARHDEKTGLGLAIVKGLIEQMDGQIKADLKEEILTIEIKLKPLTKITLSQ